MRRGVGEREDEGGGGEREREKVRRGVGERQDEGEEEKEEGERDSACSAMHPILGATVQGRAGQHDYVTWCGVIRFVRGYKSVKRSNLQFTSLQLKR